MPEKGLRPLWLTAKPDRKYKNKGWVDWGHFLGTGNVQSQKKKFWSFEYSRKHLRPLGIKSGEDFKRYMPFSCRIS